MGVLQNVPRHVPVGHLSTSWALVVDVRAFVPFEIQILEKADGKRRSFLEWKNLCFFTDPQKTKKSWPELLHWFVEDFLTAWMSSTLSGQWLWIPARQCFVTPPKSDATVSTTEHSRLHSCYNKWASYSPDLNPLDQGFWEFLQDLVYELYEGRQLPFAKYGTWKRQSKTNGRRSPLRQFENPLHNGKTTECG